MVWVGIEMGLVVVMAGIARVLQILRALLRAQLGQRINELILEKALTLELTQFEDSDLYDKMTRARREASARPLSLVSQTFDLGQSFISLASYGALLAAFSRLALGTIGTLAFYGMYLWIALSAIDGKMSIGAMTMYVIVFKQGQSALSNALSDIGGMYEDNLYLSNLYEFLDTAVTPAGGDAS